MALRDEPNRMSSQWPCVGAVPSSTRRSRSPSVKMPTSAPVPSSTGKPLTCLSSMKRIAASIAVVSVTVATFGVITSAARIEWVMRVRPGNPG